MANTTRRIARATALLTVLYCARRYYRNWGSTKAESQMRVPGDALVSDPAVQTTEAVDVDATAPAVWSWLVQMARDRGAAAPTTPAAQGDNAQLQVGDRIRLAPEGWMGLPDGVTLDVAEIAPEKYLVLNALRSEPRWNAVLSFHLQPHWEDRVRLLARARIGLRYPGEVFVLELARPAIALGTRALLLAIKRRAERSEPVRSSVETS
ncbi:SRPBCC family protein [Mycobacterium sp. SMC-2]|uniref:SRPBCC family protein n=1 Tax=Mycobacterium sp. SMC-2 TaxID=2857058 RepID=UPI0021B1CB36|nr:SRPBCC family protein [Mycobacterium sp. SMC-2]UXA08344.1 SRPBCC family protein [Mycobacterium sp. SMC-2]